MTWINTARSYTPVATLAACVLVLAAALALVGCGSNGDAGASAGQVAAEATAGAEAASTVQDNCYGDDLPVINN